MDFRTHFATAVDSFFAWLSGYYAANAWMHDNLGGLLFWAFITWWISYCLVVDMSKENKT